MTTRSHNPKGITALTFGIVALSFAVGCGGGAEEAEPEAAPEPAAAEEPMAESSAGPRVFFVQPQDGATLPSPVSFEFGHENFVIEARGEGDIHEGAGHHHIGVDTECLPPGTAIPEADPWVHFGDGSAVIDMQLPSGEHTLTIQVGDGMHVTLDEPGLCTSITITVE